MPETPHSGNVHSVEHDGTALVVCFRAKDGGPGRRYTYPGAGVEHVDGMVNAHSPGKYFRQHVMGKFEGSRADAE